jgi:hypothetical protein
VELNQDGSLERTLENRRSTAALGAIQMINHKKHPIYVGH